MTIGVKSSLLYILRHWKPELTEADNKNPGAEAAIVVMMVMMMAVAIAMAIVVVTTIIFRNNLSS